MMDDKYIRTPESISINDIMEKGCSFSPSQYMDLLMPNRNYRFVRDFLSRPLSRGDLGMEIGRDNYIDKSPYYFFRVKAFQPYSFIPQLTSESVLPIMPGSFVCQDLRAGDLLISKDSNIGEAVILDKDYPNFMTSGAIYKLPVSEHKYYLFAFIKHRMFREQLDFIVPKGATIRHAKTMFLDCKIPIPNENVERTMGFIELLVQAIINKEIEINKKHSRILREIRSELEINQKDEVFRYEYPTVSELVGGNRIDAAYNSERYKSLVFPVINYKDGFTPLTQQGLELKPGPSLEVKLLGTRVDSDTYIKGFYRLITPKQINNNGTVKQYEYIGTPKNIPPVQYGDILFGESGTGRSMVYLENDNNTINNAHAHILRPIEGLCSLEKAITVRCILQYYKEIGLIDCLTVGGAGGHLSPSYFDRVYIPAFPEIVQHKISKLYYSRIQEYDIGECTMENFIENDSIWNYNAGIYELDKMLKSFKSKLDTIIDDIINNRTVIVDLK